MEPRSVVFVPPKASVVETKAYARTSATDGCRWSQPCRHGLRDPRRRLCSRGR
jgi:hypothetical protein